MVIAFDLVSKVSSLSEQDKEQILEVLGLSTFDLQVTLQDDSTKDYKVYGYESN